MQGAEERLRQSVEDRLGASAALRACCPPSALPRRPGAALAECTQLHQEELCDPKDDADGLRQEARAALLAGKA